MFGLTFSRRADEDAWWYRRPDLKTYEQVREEMAERDLMIYEPPQHNGKDSLQALLHFALRAGVIATITYGLVWFLAVTINTKLDAISVKQDTIQAMLLTHTVSTASLMERFTHTDSVLERMAALMLVQCVNSAETSGDRAECARAAGK